MTERVRLLRDQSLNAEPFLTPERAVIITEFYKNAGFHSAPVKRALAFKAIMEKKEVLKKNVEEKDIAATYNEFKEFEGEKYTGMKVGRTHKWYYDKGEWKEKKITPDKWEFTYAVAKRRAGKAPEGSGVPVGTEYHWWIIAHQNVRKLDANNYSTSMTGIKYKLAHKRFDKEKWSASDNAHKKKMIKLLQEMIDDLSMDGEATEQV